LRNSGEDFLVEGENKSATKNKGKMIHDILSSVNKYDDIKFACLKAVSTGIINEIELTEIEDTLKAAFKNPLVADWFNEKYTVVNERNLITQERILRPDRIMFYENEAIVVDYKTGEKKLDKYNSQVKRYAKIIKQTGFEKVRGYLWYINQNDVELVCEL
jgi:ATP-dependent exoDNAse (exonuclease V) beta subunit